MISAPDPGDSGYWTFMSMAIVVLFVFYVSGRGELGRWIKILVPAPAAAPKATGAGQAPSSYGSGGEGALAAPGNAVQGNTSSAPSAGKVAGPTSGPTAPVNPLEIPFD